MLPVALTVAKSVPLLTEAARVLAVALVGFGEQADRSATAVADKTATEVKELEIRIRVFPNC